MATNVIGIKQTVSELQKLEKTIISAARKDIKSAAEPMRSGIQSAIPSQAPLRGMRHRGRTGWQPENIRVVIKTNFTRKAQAGRTSIVSIVVGGKSGSAGTAGLMIADMAGIRGKIGTGRSREYRTGMSNTSSHRLNGQGRVMINKLSGRFGSPSRFVWREANRHLPEVKTQLSNTIDKVNHDLTNKFKSNRTVG
jgi:hypothetical protein